MLLLSRIFAAIGALMVAGALTYLALPQPADVQTSWQALADADSFGFAEPAAEPSVNDDFAKLYNARMSPRVFANLHDRASTPQGRAFALTGLWLRSHWQYERYAKQFREQNPPLNVTPGTIPAVSSGKELVDWIDADGAFEALQSRLSPLELETP